MNLDKAIEILTQHVTRAWPASDPDLRDATILGLEALKDQGSMRIVGILREDYLLPSETKD